MKFIFAFLMFTFSLHGQILAKRQSLGSRHLPVAAASAAAFFATNIQTASAMLYWTSRDFAVGDIVGTWTDRISGVVATTNILSACAGNTNSAKGVAFNIITGPWRYLFSAQTIQTNFTCYIVYTPSSTQNNYDCLFGAGGASKVFYFNASKMEFYAGGGVATETLPTSGTMHYVWSNGVSYTNGVLCKSITPTTGNFLPTSIGCDNFSSEYFTGYIAEICVWTNTMFTAGQVNQLYTNNVVNYPL